MHWAFVNFQLRQQLTDAKLMELATEVAARDIKSIAISDMGLTEAKITNLSDDERNKSEILSFEILRRWRNKLGNTKEAS